MSSIDRSTLLVLSLLIAIAFVIGTYRAIVEIGLPTLKTPQNPVCGTRYLSYESLRNPISVLVIKSASTGTICVEYANTLNISISLPSYVSICRYNLTGPHGVCSSCAFNEVTSDFAVSASPSKVYFAPGPAPDDETTAVALTIVIPSNVPSVIYAISISQFCSPFPAVVVSGSASTPILAASNFSSWYPHTGSCPAQSLSARLLGVGGFRVESVTG